MKGRTPGSSQELGSPVCKVEVGTGVPVSRLLPG